MPSDAQLITASNALYHYALCKGDVAFKKSATDGTFLYMKVKQILPFTEDCARLEYTPLCAQVIAYVADHLDEVRVATPPDPHQGFTFEVGKMSECVHKALNQLPPQFFVK